jgi:hypothetical protein
LLRPQLFVVVGLEGSRGSLFQRLLEWLPFGRPTQHQATETERLDERAEQVALLLDHAGVAPQRLNDDHIAELLYACWCAERARQQPLRAAASASPTAPSVARSA